MIHIKYERKTCGRCGGSGRHSFCELHGDRCFGCGGTGIVLSAKGKRAKAALEGFLVARYGKPADAVQVGDQIRPGGVAKWVTVREITTGGGAFVDVNDAGERVEIPAVNLRTGRTTYGYRPDTFVSVRPTKEQFLDEVVPFARTLKGLTITETEEV